MVCTVVSIERRLIGIRGRLCQAYEVCEWTWAEYYAETMKAAAAFVHLGVEQFGGVAIIGYGQARRAARPSRPPAALNAHWGMPPSSSFAKVPLQSVLTSARPGSTPRNGTWPAWVRWPPVPKPPASTPPTARRLASTSSSTRSRPVIPHNKSHCWALEVCVVFGLCSAPFPLVSAGLLLLSVALSSCARLAPLVRRTLLLCPPHPSCPSDSPLVPASPLV